jgi:Siphovirus ReqiPepy6 Gp37-like protein
MEPYTLSRSFLKQNIIDEFLSIIWTERYYGDSEVELVVPASIDLIQKLPVGTFLGLPESDEIMILQTVDIESGKLKVTGISLLSWLNNRFIRVTAKHDDRYWTISGGPAGWVLWAIIYYMCHRDSPYLNGGVDIGVPNPQQFVIPGLGLSNYDTFGDNITVAVPYGPVYDAMKEIATTYQLGMQLILTSADDSGFNLGFRSYRGIDHTTGQTVNPPVRFSPDMDSFTNIKELQSIAAFKTLVYAFAPGLKPDEGQPDLTTVPGMSSMTGPEYTGFDLRAQMVFAEDITTDQVGGDPQTLVNILNSRAQDARVKNHFVKAVDGEIVPESQFRYGIQYNLGDLIEVQGNSGFVQTARITEYIRSQDPSGEKAYPTVSMIG